MLCCIRRNSFQIGDEEELKKEKLEKQIKKIKKELFKTRKNNHIGFGISSNVFKVNIDEQEVSCKVIKLGFGKSNQKFKKLKYLKKLVRSITQCSRNLFVRFKQKFRKCYLL